jgi:outer membrane protein assembly factor BamB
MRTQNSRRNIRCLALILLLAASAVLASLPKASAPISLTLSPHFNQFIGQNSETLIIYTVTPNILSTDPDYKGKTSVWSDAKIIFTRPDGTQDVLNGPLTVAPSVPQGVAVERFLVYYTPNMKGAWRVTFYWPGDAKYASVNQTTSFYVGDYIPKRKTYAFLSMSPYPVVGLGQYFLINAWVSPPPLTNYQAYFNYMFTFTKPDGTTFKVGPVNSEAPGTFWFNIYPDMLGNWTIKFEFPGDYANLPSSVTRTFTVQRDPVRVGYPDTPLPSSAWTFPINVQNREWRTIAGEWLQAYYNASQGSWNPYTEAPRTPHVLWKLPAYTGLGGYIGSPHSIQTGAQVEGEVGDMGIFPSSVPTIRTVMAGRGYYTAGGNIYCVDMRTGQTLWKVPGSFNVGASRATYGPVLYSFGTRFIAYSGIDGSVILNVTGQSMNYFDDPYVYTYQRTNTTTGEGRLIKWDTTGTSDNFTSRIVWNVTNVLPYTTTAHCLIQGNLLIARHFLTEGVQNYGVSTSNTVIVDYITAVNLTTGAMEYNVTTLNPSDPTTWIHRQGPAIGSGYGLVYFAALDDVNKALGYVAFNAATGRLAWHSEQTDYPWGAFWAYMPQASAYGMVIALGYTGVYAFNATNGKVVWHYIDDNPFFEEPYGSNIAPDGSTYSTYAFGSTGPVIGGGVVFAPNTEHSPTFYYRGQGLCAIDAFTGKQLWKIKGIYTPTAIAYGILLASDSVNGYTYAFGKGETATTVSASSDVIPKGSSVLIKGAVTDQSPAQKGTPAIADEYMTLWMEYLHMQQPMPKNATGVPVKLQAIASDGSVIDIGTVRSDMNGVFKKLWTPPAEGEYTIVATFEGSESYYSSSNETVIGVVAAAAPSASPSMPPTSPTAPPTTPVSPTVAPPTGEAAAPVSTLVVAAVAAVVVAAVAAAVILRRRKRAAS